MARKSKKMRLHALEILPGVEGYVDRLWLQRS
jgi:hypothetical protein